MIRPRAAKLLPVILLEILGLVIVVCLTRIPAYPLIHDIPNLHIIAQRILAGAVPYRDVIDMNLPGIYLIHLLVVLIPGDPNIVWFCFHFSWALLTAAAAWFLLRSESRLAAWMAAVTVIAYYVTRKAFYYGQRDFLLLLPVLLGILAFIHFEKSGRKSIRWLFWSGLAFGLASTIKPLPLAFSAAAGIWLVLDRISTLRQRWLRMLSLAAGTLVPLALVALWLALSGGLADFLRLAPNLSAVYYNWQHLNWGEMLFFTTIESRIFFGMVVLALGLSYLREKRLPATPLFLALYTGLGYGVIHYFSQGKGWEYHQLPFNLFAILLTTALFLRMAVGAGPRLAVLACLCLYLPLVGILPRAAWIMIHDPAGYLDIFQPAVHKLDADYDRLNLSGKSIQLLDMTTGGAYLLYSHQVPLSTPYLLDFELQANPNPAYLQFRQVFMQRMLSAPPEFFIIARETKADSPLSYRRFADWTDFTGWLESDYHLVSDQTEYQIFEHN